MQRVMLTKDLPSICHGAAALCYERTRVQKEQHEFRHCPRDKRHDAWDAELRKIERQRTELVQQQQLVSRRSKLCGIGVKGVCI
jgi:hypothetical protein